jgi:speckle-type POZ protein
VKVFFSESANVMNISTMEGWCQTETKILKIAHLWTILNFTSYFGTGLKKLTSSLFIVDSSKNLKFNLILINSNDPNLTNYISVYVKFVEYHEVLKNASFKFTIINSKNEEMNAKEGSCSVPNSSTKVGFTKFIHKDLLLDSSNELLSDDKLILKCEITLTETISISGQTPISLEKKCRCYLSERLLDLFECGDFHDVIFSVSGQEFRAHKAILAIRSSVFASMFECNMQESKTGRVEISDLEPETLHVMLQFIYSDRIPELNTNNVTQILIAADKYSLDKLKSGCEEYIGKTLIFSNVFEWYSFADKYSCSLLMRFIEDFIKNKGSVLLETTEWKELLRTKTDLASQIVKILMQQLPCSNSRKRKINPV